MTSRKEIEVWKKLLGTKINSFTHKEHQYTVFLGENGWECECMDWKVRKGSHTYLFNDNGELKQLKACKHIAQAIANSGIEIWEVFGFGQKVKIQPQTSP
jgi:hypothetical protein